MDEESPVECSEDDDNFHFTGALLVMFLYQIGTLKKMDYCFAKTITGPGMESAVRIALRYLTML